MDLLFIIFVLLPNRRRRRGCSTMKQEHLEVNLDDVLVRVGVFGFWQKKIVFMLMIASFIGGKQG